MDELDRALLWLLAADGRLPYDAVLDNDGAAGDARLADRISRLR